MSLNLFWYVITKMSLRHCEYPKQSDVIVILPARRSLGEGGSPFGELRVNSVEGSFQIATPSGARDDILVGIGV